MNQTAISFGFYFLLVSTDDDDSIDSYSYILMRTYMYIVLVQKWHIYVLRLFIMHTLALFFIFKHMEIISLPTFHPIVP